MPRHAFLDTPFDPDFPVYTRANAGEILPDPVPPLGWSLIGPGLEEGFRISFCDDFGLVPRPGPERPFQMVGRMAGRLHLNLSIVRTSAQRLPGTSADVVDVQYFGDAAATGLPAYVPRADDRRHRFRAPPALGRTLAGIGRRVARDRTAVDEGTEQVRAAIDADASSAELVRLTRETMALFARVLGTHVTARALTSPLMDQARAALHRADVDDDDALALLSSIPDLESARPSRALAELARTIAPGSALAALVARRSMQAIEDAAADGSVAGAERLRQALQGFVTDFGHRGVGEFDPTNPSWGTAPDQVVALLAGQRRDPLPLPEPLEVDAGRLARPLVAAARSAVARAERTKDSTIRVTHLLRLLVDAISARCADELDGRNPHLLTIDELEGMAHGAEVIDPGEFARRARDFASSSELVPAEWSQASLRLEGEVPPDPDPESASASIGDDAADEDAPAASGPPGPHEASTVDDPVVVDDDLLTGIPGARGTATGRARILTDPFAEFEPGDILVAHMTDTAWTPLFLSAGAVVTDVGGVLSHATIVARDLGIPSVVNVKGATTRIADGDMVEVDGAAGTVRILVRV